MSIGSVTRRPRLALARLVVACVAAVRAAPDVFRSPGRAQPYAPPRRLLPKHPAVPGARPATSSSSRPALVLCVVALVALAGCSPIYRNHGYVPTEFDLATISVGQSTRDDVIEAIGRPSSEGLLEGSDWYYVGSRWQHYGYRASREISRELVAVSFTSRGRVANVERFGLESGNVVTLSRRVTDTNIRGVGLIGQLLGNLGRVDASQFFD